MLIALLLDKEWQVAIN